MKNNPISIVIVGGGPAGLAFTQVLAKEFSSSKLAFSKGVQVKITLLDKQEFYFHVFGSLRAMVDTSYINKMFIPYDDALPKNGPATIKQANVTHIDYNSKTVKYTELSSTTTRDKTLNYDYLILATGSTYPSPIKPSINMWSRNDIKSLIHETADHIKNADRILVIGGGAVGCEMAGELKAYYPEKKIMLVDSNTNLISSQDVKNIRDPLKKAMEKLGVELILGEKLTKKFNDHQFGTKTLTMESGMTIESDVQLICAGMKPNVTLMAEHPECLDENGRFIKVKPTLQVDHSDFDDVFVLGDCSNHPTPKMGYWGMEQGKHLGKSLAAHIRSGGKINIKPYPTPKTEVIIVTLGPQGGVAHLPFFGGVIMGNFFTRMIKAKDLMASMSWGNLNANMSKEK